MDGGPPEAALLRPPRVPGHGGSSAGFNQPTAAAADQHSGTGDAFDRKPHLRPLT